MQVGTLLEPSRQFVFTKPTPRPKQPPAGIRGIIVLAVLEPCGEMLTLVTPV